MGHNPYNYLYHSDHRATFIDLPMTEIFSMSQAIVSPELRSIHSDSNNVDLFITNIIQHLHENNIFKRTETLIENVNINTHPWNEANKIDDQIGIAINKAKKACQRPQRPPWSEKLHHASLKVRFWKTLETGNIIQQNQQASLIEIRNLLPTLPSEAPSMDTIQENIKISTRNLRKVRANAVNPRKEFLQELKERIATRKTQTTISTEKAIKIIENQQ